jgi:hypothetical protein
VAKAFTLDKPEEGKAVYAGFETPEGNYAILALDEVKQGDLAALPEGARKQAWREFSTILGNAEMAALQQSLRKQAEIIIPASSEE